MPKVGGVEFPYTKEGMRKAKAWSEMIGKPIQIDKKKAKKKYQQGGDTLRTHISVPRYSKNKKAGLDKLLLGSELHKKWIDQALEMQYDIANERRNRMLQAQTLTQQGKTTRYEGKLDAKSALLEGKAKAKDSLISGFTGAGVSYFAGLKD